MGSRLFTSPRISRLGHPVERLESGSCTPWIGLPLGRAQLSLLQGSSGPTKKAVLIISG